MQTLPSKSLQEFYINNQPKIGDRIILKEGTANLDYVFYLDIKEVFPESVRCTLHAVTSINGSREDRTSLDARIGAEYIAPNKYIFEIISQ